LFYTRIGSDGKISSRIGFDSSTNFEGSDGSIINDNKWHHIITVYKRNGNMTRYIDGAIYGSAIDISSVSSLNLNTSNHFTLGSTQGGSTQLFSGQIDDVRIYNYALTSEQIKQIYNGGAVNFQ
jgi:hypothetical protein